VIALVSAKGSPGVTTAALALTLAAPGRCLLAECDPAGGDILAGYLRGEVWADRGLAPLAVAHLRGRLAGDFGAHLVDLAAPSRRLLLLPGITDPAQSVTVASVWEHLVAHLRQWRAGGDDRADSDDRAGGEDHDAGRNVIIDCGRLGGAGVAAGMLPDADRVLLVVRATLPSVATAVPAARMLAERLSGRGQGVLGLLVVQTGPYRASEVAQRLGVPLVACLPWDRRAAAALSFGGIVHPRMPLLRAAAAVHASLLAGQPTVGQPTAGVGGV
jgi:hypothetical protein